jgi:hypothetical protein
MASPGPNIDSVSLVFSLAWCYIVGVVAGNLLFVPLTQILVIPSMIGAFVLALPIFVIGALIALLFRRNLEAHLLAWCLIAPVAVTIAWVLLEHFVILGPQGAGAARHAQDAVAWMRAALALTCASIASTMFYRRHAPY